MRLSLKTAPTKEPITLDEAKLHLKVDGADDNVLISTLIIAAREIAEKTTKRAFITQVWEMFLDSAPSLIDIPKPPLQSIESIKVLDDAGDSSTIDPGDYLEQTSEVLPGRIRPNIGLGWPLHRGFDSFIVEFKAGYGDDETDIPGSLRREMLALVALWYDKRGFSAGSTIMATAITDEQLQQMFGAYKVYTF